MKHKVETHSLVARQPLPVNSIDVVSAALVGGVLVLFNIEDLTIFEFSSWTKILIADDDKRYVWLNFFHRLDILSSSEGIMKHFLFSTMSSSE